MSDESQVSAPSLIESMLATQARVRSLTEKIGRGLELSADERASAIERLDDFDVPTLNRLLREEGTFWQSLGSAERTRVAVTLMRIVMDPGMRDLSRLEGLPDQLVQALR